MNRARKAVWFVIIVLAAGPAFAGAGTGTDRQGSLEKQWSETVTALKSYTAQQRDKALEAGKKTLDAMDQRMDELEAWTHEHWNSLSKESRKKNLELLAEMRRQRNKVAQWYGGMKHSSAGAWNGVKQGFIKSYNKLQTLYHRAARSSAAGDKNSSE